MTIKLWDIGGQPRFRSMWERYCRGVNAIVYMVDAADLDKIEASRNELHNLLEKPQVRQNTNSSHWRIFGEYLFFQMLEQLQYLQKMFKVSSNNSNFLLSSSRASLSWCWATSATSPAPSTRPGSSRR